jgi:hypothetical protein
MMLDVQANLRSSLRNVEIILYDELLTSLKNQKGKIFKCSLCASAGDFIVVTFVARDDCSKTALRPASEFNDDAGLPETN